jgi:hypothetical protein
VVEAALMGERTGTGGAFRPGRRSAAVAALAIGFLLVMLLSGRMRESEQYVRFEPAGLARNSAEEIDEIELVVGEYRLGFRRGPGGSWLTRDGAEVPAAARGHLDMSLRFMHATEPVRVMSADEYRGEALREFGLDPPRYAVSLRRRAEAVLTARFGSSNPQAVLQYVQVEGRDDLYLLPVFVGREWERVAEETTGQ